MEKLKEKYKDATLNFQIILNYFKKLCMD